MVRYGIFAVYVVGRGQLAGHVTRYSLRAPVSGRLDQARPSVVYVYIVTVNTLQSTHRC